MTGGAWHDRQGRGGGGEGDVEMGGEGRTNQGAFVTVTAEALAPWKRWRDAGSEGGGQGRGNGEGDGDGDGDGRAVPERWWDVVVVGWCGAVQCGAVRCAMSYVSGVADARADRNCSFCMRHRTN